MMDKNDLYQLRAADFAENFRGLREVEWHTTYQLYAAYGAIALTYYSLSARLPGSRILAIAGLAVTLVTFVGGLFLDFQHQRRLHFTRTMQNEYLKALHTELNAQELPPPSKTVEPGFKKWYAFIVRTVFGACVMGVLITFIIVTTKAPLPRCVSP
jgi:hypothetical protein